MDSNNVFNFSEIITRAVLQEKFEEAHKNQRYKEVKFIDFVVISLKRRVLENNEAGNKNLNEWFSLPIGIQYDVYLEIEDILKTIFTDSIITIKKGSTFDVNDNSAFIEIDWSEPRCGEVVE